MIGDSLTMRWVQYFPPQFSGYIAKGVGGENCSDMLSRFQSDVIASHPDIVVIWCGTNDIGNNIPQADSEKAVLAMAVAARSAGVIPILCTIPPYGAQYASLNPAVQAWNTWVRANAANLADFYPLLADANGELQADLSIGDGIHLNSAGYALLDPVLSAAVFVAH